MVQNVNTLTWQPIAAEDDEWAAVLSLDTAVDTLFRIGVVGAAPGGDAANIRPTYAVVDNMANNGVVNMSFGPFVYVVPQFTRKTFKIPISLRSMLINATVGVVGLALVKSQYAPDDANFFEISQASVSPLLFPHKDYSVTTGQIAGDQNTYTLFSPVAADIAYNLIAAGVAPLQDGWLQFVRNEGTKNVSVTPAAGNVLNGVFTNAAPLLLRPGDSGVIQFDGASWHFQGHTHLLSADVAFTAGVVTTTAHGLGLIPTGVQVFIVCRTADGNFVAGNKLAVGQYFATQVILGDKTPASPYALQLDATNLVFTTGNPTAVYVTDKTTGNVLAITVASWRYQIQLDLWQ